MKKLNELDLKKKKQSELTTKEKIKLVRELIVQAERMLELANKMQRSKKK